MRIQHFAALGILVAALTPLSAHAQSYTVPGVTPALPPVAASSAPPTIVSADFDQFPSYIQMTSKLQDGTEAVLRCGYMVTSAGVAPDAGFLELSTLNERNGLYYRTQRIDHTVIGTIIAPGGQSHFLVEAGAPNGPVNTKNCLSDGNNDVLQNCVATPPFAAGTQLMQQDADLTNQCSTFFSKVLTQIVPATYNAQKTEIFKAALRQKAALITTP